MKRTIAAILAADVAGYSRLIAEDEEDTLRRLAAAKGVFREHVAGHNGRVFNTAGDAILAEFPSAVEALRAGLAIQDGLDDLDRGDPPARRVRFRMGLTIGDVVEVDGDLLGDGVNIAARLEGISEPGGICLSRSVHEAVSGKTSVAFKDIGPQKLKNIPRPVHAFRVVRRPDPASLALLAAGSSRRARLVRWGGAALMLALALGLGTLLWTAGPSLRRADLAADADAAGRDDLISVSVARTKRICFPDQIRLTGLLGARRMVDVRPESEGLRVLRVLAKPLEEVRAGQVLAQLVRPGDPENRPIPVRSPVAGVVAASTASVDQMASARGPALFQVVGDGEFELEADAPLADLSRIVAGQEVGVTPLGEPERRGRVRLVSTGIEPTTQTGRVRVLLGNGDGLRQGQFASGVVRVAERCGLAVPHAAVAQDPDGAVVYVANSRRIEARPVTTGLTLGRDVEIREGLEERDMVVARAGPFLREGDIIHAVNVTAR